MYNAALIQHNGRSALGVEETLISEVVGQFRMASTKQVSRGRIKLEDYELPVGDLGFMRAIFNQCKINMPAIDDYPFELTPFLHRNIRKSRLRPLLANADYDPPVFIKPAGKLKHFTGFILDRSLPYQLVGRSTNIEVYVSDVVHWQSEWRYYMIGDRIAFRSPAPGTDLSDPAPDFNVIQVMIESFREKLLLRGATIMDVGVLSNGETALVEVNDAFAIGAYEGMPAEVYLQILTARWDTLTNTNAPRIKLF